MRILTIAILSIAAAACGQTTGDADLQSTEPIEQTLDVPYLVYLPEGYEPTGEPWPVLFYLHGSYAVGEQYDIQRILGIGPWGYARQHDDFPMVIVAPFAPNHETWDEVEARPAAIAVLDEALATLNLDPDRVYLTGVSSGGIGAAKLAAQHPDRFTAMALLCADSLSAATVRRLRDIPIWNFQGDRDGVQKLPGAAVTSNQLRAIGAEPRTTVYENTGHDVWSRTYRRDDLYTWLLSHTRATATVERREHPDLAAGEVHTRAFTYRGSTQLDAPLEFYLPTATPPRQGWPVLIYLTDAPEGRETEPASPIEFARENNLPMAVVSAAFAPDISTGEPFWSDEMTLSALLLPELVRGLAEAGDALDPDRIYLGGAGVGATGVYEVAKADPSPYAALLLIGGAPGRPYDIHHAKHLPMLFHHGLRDRQFPAEETLRIYREVQGMGRSQLYLHNGAGRELDRALLEDMDTYTWMYRHRRQANQ